MFKDTEGVKFCSAEDAQKAVQGSSLKQLLELVKKAHPAALSLVMAECMTRIAEDAEDENITLVLRGRWFVGPLGKMVQEEVDDNGDKHVHQLSIGTPVLRGPKVSGPRPMDREVGPNDPRLGGCELLSEPDGTINLGKLRKIQEKGGGKNE